MDKKHLNARDHLERFSQARVLTPSRKPTVAEWGLNEAGERVIKRMCRPLTAADCRAAVARKFSR